MGISVSNIVSKVDVSTTPRISEKKEKTIGEC